MSHEEQIGRWTATITMHTKDKLWIKIGCQEHVLSNWQAQLPSIAREHNATAAEYLDAVAYLERVAALPVPEPSLPEPSLPTVQMRLVRPVSERIVTIGDLRPGMWLRSRSGSYCVWLVKKVVGEEIHVLQFSHRNNAHLRSVIPENQTYTASELERYEYQAYHVETFEP